MNAPDPLARGLDAFAGAASWWVDIMRRGAAAVLIVTVVACAVAAVYTARNLSINTDTPALISPDLPFRRDAAAYKSAFPQFSDTIAIVLEGDTVDRAEDAQIALAERLREDRKMFRTVFAPDADPFFATNGLLYLDADELSDLSDRLAEAQPLLVKLAQDPSLRGLFDVLGLAVDEIADGKKTAPKGLVDVMNRIDRIAAETVAGAPSPLSWFDLMKGEVPSRAERRRFITVQPVLDFSGLAPGKEAMSAIREYAAKLNLTPEHGVHLSLTGGAAMATEELESVAKSARLAGLISLILVTAVLAIGIRSVRMVIAMLVTLIAGLIGTAAFTTFAIGHLNLISVAFAVLFIGLGIDFGIHFALRYREEAAQTGDHAKALSRATRGVAGALGLCALAAAASFFAFVPTDYDGLSELGLIAGTGMFIALFANLTVLPALLTLMPPKVTTEPGLPIGGVERLVRDHARSISLAALAAGVAAAMLLPAARFDSDPVALKDPTTESVRTFHALMRDSDTAPYTIQILAPDLTAAKAQAARLKRLKEVDHTLTLANFIPANQEEKLETIETMGIFLAPLLSAPAATAQIADRRAPALAFRDRLRTLLAKPGRAGPLAAPARRLADSLETLAGREGALATLERALLVFLPARLARLRASLDADQVTSKSLPGDLRARFLAADGHARIQVFPAENINDDQALRRFVASVRTIAPKATDSPVEIVESGEVVVGAVRDAALIALAAIVVMLLALLRSVRGTILVILPLALAALVTVAMTVLTGHPFNFANVIVLPLLAGLGVAGAVHLVVRAGDSGQVSSLLRSSTPRAVILSALTTIASFGSLSVSTHRGMSSMGELLTIAITISLLSTLVVLPALMGWTRPGTAEDGTK